MEFLLDTHTLLWWGPMLRNSRHGQAGDHGADALSKLPGQRWELAIKIACEAATRVTVKQYVPSPIGQWLIIPPRFFSSSCQVETLPLHHRILRPLVDRQGTDPGSPVVSSDAVRPLSSRVFGTPA